MIKNIILQQVFIKKRLNVQKNTFNNLSKFASRIYNLTLIENNKF